MFVGNWMTVHDGCMADDFDGNWKGRTSRHLLGSACRWDVRDGVGGIYGFLCPFSFGLLIPVQ